MNIDRLSAMLERHEGRRLMPYRDSVGKLTIGVGRNIEDVGLSNSEVDFLLANDITNRYEALERLTWFRQLNEARQEAIVDMSFMGLTRLLGFQKMIAALTAGRYEDAAAELLKSKYAKQVGQRAIDLAHIIKTGSY